MTILGLRAALGPEDRGRTRRAREGIRAFLEKRLPRFADSLPHPHLLTRAAQRDPDRPAWIEGDLTISFREAEARVNRLARALLQMGGRPGDRVAMLVPNCHQGLETILAAMKAGMAVVPLNVRLRPAVRQGAQARAAGALLGRPRAQGVTVPHP